jgi:hypothetical protein
VVIGRVGDGSAPAIAPRRYTLLHK